MFEFQESSNKLSSLVAAVVVTLLGMTFGVQKLLKGWKETSTETSVIRMMHDELTRLSEQNTKLATELSKFQLEVVKLNNQLNEVSIENHRLHREVLILTVEVSELQTVLRRNDVL